MKLILFSKHNAQNFNLGFNSIFSNSCRSAAPVYRCAAVNVQTISPLRVYGPILECVLFTRPHGPIIVHQFCSHYCDNVNYQRVNNYYALQKFAQGFALRDDKK